MINLNEIYPQEYLKKALSKKDNSQIGTPSGHYASADQGPFRCGNCIHFINDQLCDHPKVVEDAKDGYMKMQKRYGSC